MFLNMWNTINILTLNNSEKDNQWDYADEGVFQFVNLPPIIQKTLARYFGNKSNQSLNYLWLCALLLSLNLNISVPKL